MIKELYLKWKMYKRESFINSLDSDEMQKLLTLIQDEAIRKGMSYTDIYSMSIQERLEMILRL